MSNKYASPVGIIKKDIYVIKNDINNKLYVGQSLNAKERFMSHCKGDYNNSLIDKAIQKYGKKHFWFEIIESQIENYNEREVFWIKELNAMKPNGYNIMPGGEEPPRLVGENSPSAKIADETVAMLKRDLAETNIPLNSLAEKYGISKRQVDRINRGISRAFLNETYPIRKIPNSSNKLTDEDIDEIVELLEYTYQLNGQIARQFGVEVHLISDINQGIAYRRDDVEYPIRNWKSCGHNFFTYEEVTEIIKLLKETNLSFREIARMYNVEHGQVSAICYGTSKKYLRKNEKYPIRKMS